MNGLHLDMSAPFARWAVQSLIATGILSAVACLVCRIARNSPLVRLWASTLALGACLLVPGLSWVAMQGGFAVVKIPVAVPVTAPVSAPSIELDERATEVESGPTAYVDDATSTVLPSGNTPIVASESVPVTLVVPKSEEPIRLPGDWRWLALSLYALGVAWTGTRLLLGTARLANVLRSSNDPAPSLLARLRLSGLEPERPSPFFSIRTSDQVTSPLVAGVLRPSLVFPESFDDCLTPEEMRQILAHEEVHAKGRHSLFGLLHRTATIVFWFNPFVHDLANDLTRTLEELCDNAALEFGSASSFARLLVRLAEGQGRSRVEGLALGVLDDRISLERRVRGLLDPYRRTTKTMKPHTRFAIVGTSILATLTLAGTQIVAAQSAWDDISPSVQSSPGPQIAIAQEPRLDTKAARKRARKAERQARKAGRLQVARVAGAEAAAAPIRIDQVVEPAGRAARTDTAVAIPLRGRRQTETTPEGVTIIQSEGPAAAPRTVRRSESVAPVITMRGANRNVTTIVSEPTNRRVVLADPARAPQIVLSPQSGIAAPAEVATRGATRVIAPRIQTAGRRSRNLTVTQVDAAGRAAQLGGTQRTEVVAGDPVTGYTRTGEVLPAQNRAPRVTYTTTGQLGGAVPARSQDAFAPTGAQAGQLGGSQPAQTQNAFAPTGAQAGQLGGTQPAHSRNAFAPTGAQAGQLGGTRSVQSRNAFAPAAAQAGQRVSTPGRETKVTAAGQVSYNRAVAANGQTYVITSDAHGNHKPVQVIKGATVIIYDDGTTVISNGKVTHTAPKVVRTVTRAAKSTAKPKKPVARKTSK